MKYNYSNTLHPWSVVFTSSFILHISLALIYFTMSLHFWHNKKRNVTSSIWLNAEHLVGTCKFYNTLRQPQIFHTSWAGEWRPYSLTHFSTLSFLSFLPLFFLYICLDVTGKCLNLKPKALVSLNWKTGTMACRHKYLMCLSKMP